MKFDPALITPLQYKEEKALWVPHPYHIEGVNFLLERLLAQIWWTPGLGKTTLALATFEHLRRSGAAKRMLVVAPLRVAQTTWSQEVDKWANFSHLSVAVLHGSKKEMMWNAIELVIFMCLVVLMVLSHRSEPYGTKMILYSISLVALGVMKFIIVKNKDKVKLIDKEFNVN